MSVAELTRWTDPTELGRWRNRAGAAAAWIPVGAVVLDIGCGDMCLEGMLTGTTYVPVDCVRRDRRTVIRDLEMDTLPLVIPQPTHVVVLGVLEYIRNREHFVSELEAVGADVVLSYHFRSSSRDWQSMMSAREFWDLFDGFIPEKTKDLDGDEVLMYLRPEAK